jgi:WD40 repeat protein
MPKRMVGALYGEVIAMRSMDLRQGLEPVPFFSPLFEYPAIGTGSTIAIGPEYLGGVMQNGSSGAGSFRYYPDLNTLAGSVTPSAAFAGNMTCCAVGATFYAVGGNSPFLYVFNRNTHALVTVATTGLGTLRSMAFSPDGTKLAITHDTTPFVRIYNTSTWAYVDAPAGGSTSTYSCEFSGDSAYLLVQSAGSPYLAIHNPVTGARTFSYTANSKYSASTNSARTIVRHPTANRFIFSFGASPFIGEFDPATNTITDYTAVTSGGVIGAGWSLVVDPDVSEDAIYLRHGTGSTNPSRTMSKFKVSTRAPYANQPNVFRHLLWAYNSANPCNMVITHNTPYKITGTVRDISNNPVARVVRAHRRSDGELAAQTTSDAATGNYDLRVPDIGPFDVQFMAAAGELLNDLFFAQTEPQPV